MSNGLPWSTLYGALAVPNTYNGNDLRALLYQSENMAGTSIKPLSLPKDSPFKQELHPSHS